MSWWDTYLAPGDLRRRQQHHSPTESLPRCRPGTTHDGAPNSITAVQAQDDAITLPAQVLNNNVSRLDPSHRHRRQQALFLGGLTFTLLSLTLTRRTIRRKRIVAYPSLFTPSHMHIAPPPGPQREMSKVEGSLMAIEALGLATLNVVSIFMAGIGGAMMWFDVAEMEDLRMRVATEDGGGVEGNGLGGEADSEVEGWIAGAFGGGDVQKDVQQEREGDGSAHVASREEPRLSVLEEIERSIARSAEEKGKK